MGLLESINGPLQDLWLTRAGGDRPVGTPQFGRLYPRLPPTKCLPARKTPLNLPPVSPKGPEMGKIVSPGGGIFPGGKLLFETFNRRGCCHGAISVSDDQAGKPREDALHKQ